MTAASAPVTDPTKIFTSTTTQLIPWQDEAWRYVRCIGELGYFVRWRSNACGQVRLVASEIDEDTGEPTGSVDPDNTEGQKVVDLVKKIAGGPLGQKQLIKKAAACLTVPGELWICILQRPKGEQWFAVSKKEMGQSQKMVDLPGGGVGPTIAIKLPDGTKHDYDPDNDAMFRVWNESFEDGSQADSPVRAVLDSLGEIERATKKIRNADRSRLLNNGLLMVPSEASLPDSVETNGTGPSVTRRVAATLQKMLRHAAEVATSDENSMASVLPIVGAAPGEHLGKIVHIEFAKEATKVAVEIRNDAIARVAMGLDMSPERLLGMGSNSNHWSAYLLADEDVRLHINPVLEVLVQAIYESVFVQLLESQNIDPAKYTLWFDSSQLTKDPDVTDESKDAYGSGVITSESHVRNLGLPEDSLYDFTTEEGIALWAKDRVSAKPELLPLLGQMIPEFSDFDFEPEPLVDPYADPYTDPATSESSSDTPTPTPTNADTNASTREPGTEKADPTTPTYSAIEELFANRALEMAAKRRIGTRDRATFARLRSIPPHQRNKFLPAVTPDEVQRLTAGWTDILTPEFAQQRGLNRQALIDAVNRRVTAELTGAHANVHAVNGATL